MGLFSVALWNLDPGSHLEVTKHNSKTIEPISVLPQFTKKRWRWGWDGVKRDKEKKVTWRGTAWHLARTNCILKKQVCFAREGRPGE